MKLCSFASLVVFWNIGITQTLSATLPDPKNDWAWWRGPNFNGVAAENQSPPTQFDEQKNVVWRTAVPGRGHASPVVVGDQIFLATADEQSEMQGVVCFNRTTGQQEWITPVHQGNLPAGVHKKNTHASGTVACNGKHLYVVFYNEDQIKVSCLTVGGELVWSESAGPFDPEKYKFGYGSSPLLYDESVIVIGEADSGSFLVAFSQLDGSKLWTTQRVAHASYSSPIVGNIAGKEQLLLSGHSEVISYDPKSGEEFWSAPGATMATCGTMVWDGDLVFASGGFPNSETVAVKADGSGTVVWKNKQKCYEQSMLAYDGYLYAHTDAGVGFCWRCSDGKEMWKTRLGGPVSSSITMAGGHLYTATESGEIIVYKLNPEKYEEVARTSLGTELFATPTVAGNRIFYRVAENGPEGRQEYLYCIGEN
ncbi:PQQ-binding-like beta-propeller repeat protein [Thalassoglobus sp.]|uniref:outer membrane protein assembly factor BamB family protein n=1 Tax=Thalassoglobus sp. TaxID=2795869 RepID=UPI003AA818B9